jgi:hypothetical protein
MCRQGGNCSRCVYFRQKFTLEDAIEFHAFAPLEASRRVTNAIPLGCPLFLPVHTVNCVQTLKAGRHWSRSGWGRCREAWCAFFDRISRWRLPLSFTPVLRLKRCHVCDQWYSSRVFTAGTVNCVQTLKVNSIALHTKPLTKNSCHTPLNGLKANNAALHDE